MIFPKRRGGGKLLNPTDRLDLVGFATLAMKSLTHYSQLAGAHMRTHPHTRTHTHTRSAGITLKCGWQPPTGSCRSSWISKHIRWGFSGTGINSPATKKSSDTQTLYLQIQKRRNTGNTTSLKKVHTLHMLHIWRGEKREEGDRTCVSSLVLKLFLAHYTAEIPTFIQGDEYTYVNTLKSRSLPTNTTTNSELTRRSINWVPATNPIRHLENRHSTGSMTSSKEN